MGPIERSLRAALRTSAGVSRDGAVRSLGGTARAIWNRLLAAGAIEIDRNGIGRLREWRPDSAAQRRAKEEADRRTALQRQTDEEHAQWAERHRAREAERRAKLAEQEVLCVGLHTYAPAEQRLVLAERAAALRDSQGPGA